MELGLNDNERADAAADLKEFTIEELTITLKALHAATAIRSSMDGISVDHKEAFADLAVEFAIDSPEPTFDEHIAMVSAEIASRSN